MLQLVEMEGRVTENGGIEIPMTVLDQTGICTGDAIKLIYMAEEEEVKSASKEFLLVRNDQDVVEELAREQRVSLQIPEFRWMQILTLCARTAGLSFFHRNF